MVALYEIADNVRQALALLDAETADDGEIPPGLEADLDAVHLDFEHKAVNVARFLRQLELEAVAVGQEKDRLARLQSSLTAKADWLRQYLLRCMLATGQQCVGQRPFQLSIRKNSRPSIQLAAGAAIPPGLARTKVEFDGTKAYALWRRGDPLPPGVRIIEGFHLQIS